MKLSRRTFLGAAAAATAASGTSLASLCAAESPSNPPLPALLGNRFLTFNTVIRVNQVEAGRKQDIGVDESAIHTPAAVQALRDAFSRGWPGGRMTWAFSWRALQDQRGNYQAIRDLVRSFHKQYGDEITFFAGGYFANMYNTREQVNRDLHDALALVSAMVGLSFIHNSQYPSPGIFPSGMGFAPWLKAEMTCQKSMEPNHVRRNCRRIAGN
jgi:hypothetical protein